MGFRSFEEIEAWQMARALNRGIWRILNTSGLKGDFALKDQINRAAGSIMDNIAEGFDGGSNAEFAKFLTYSQRSCNEVQSQLYRALDREFIDDAEFREIYETASQIRNKTGGLVKYLRQA